MKRTFLFLALLFCAIGLIWAGGGQGEVPMEPEREGRYGGIMTRAYFAPSTLDPGFAQDITGGEICGIWGDYLAYVDEDLSIDPSR
ncbi:MAG: hypothetical protein JW820_01680, partial [Spirochaetales bacterium]|nr:hypothetical protein [Spirochaetales bacterium]